jgi:GT2 family glycosyltransferase
LDSLFEIPFDQFQRYEICRRLIKNYSDNHVGSLKILDVGGFHIGKDGKPWLPAVNFLSSHDVLVIDTIESAVDSYMKSDGRKLPFDDNSFDFVLTNDVLEHVNPNDREGFLNEILRVSKKYLIVNNPYYTSKNVMAEKIFNEYMIHALNSQHEMLSEHLMYGLPRIDFMENVFRKSQKSYAYYKSGDIDNWMQFMILRHELLSRNVQLDTISFMDSYMNQYAFESEMKLEEGYRVTFIVAKTSEETSLLQNNFLESMPVNTPLKVELPFASIGELYQLKNENEKKEKLDSYYHSFETITPRMKKGTLISQTFNCYSPGLHKIGVLVATYKELLAGTVKLTLEEKNTGTIISERIVSLQDFRDNCWYYMDFPTLFGSEGKLYDLKVEQLTSRPGISLYYSEQHSYGSLSIDSEVVNGSLTIQIFVKEMRAPEILAQTQQLLRDTTKEKEKFKIELEKALLHNFNLEQQKEVLGNQLSQLNNENIALQKEIQHTLTTQAEHVRKISNQLEIFSDSNVQKYEQVSRSLDESSNLIKLREQELKTVQQEIRETRQLLNEKVREVTVIQRTFSWRVTKPLRWATKKRRQAYKLIRAGLLFWKKNGLFKGPFVMIYKVAQIWKQEGSKGLQKKIVDSNPTLSHSRNMDFSSGYLTASKFNFDELITTAPPVQPHTKTVDIIVCVHNAYDDVKRCLISLIQHTRSPYRIIIVDDGSAEETANYLIHFAQTQNAMLIRNNQAKGYTLAANQGLRASYSDYSLLLNSDTIVSTNWLDYLVACGESSSQIGIIGPLSNTASWQSVPELLVNGDWADNELPIDVTINDMASLIAVNSQRLYPRIPFLNGFCLMIKRQLIDEIGYFDEETFGRGYGEENDYCIRAVKAGWELAVADDSYVFHAQSKSYSHERRMQLAQKADELLRTKHGQQIITDGVSVCRNDRVMEGIRARSEVMLERIQMIEDGRRKWEGRKIAIILPIMDAGGGGNVIIQEARTMLEMGIDVRIINLKRHQEYFERSYSGDPILVPVIFAHNEDEICIIASQFDAVIATAYHTVSWLYNCQEPIRCYYIQDFEPYFFEKGSSAYKKAWESYELFPDLVRLTKTKWNSMEVKKQIGVDSVIVGASVNIDLFRPRNRKHGNWPRRPLRIAAMIRPSTPRRNPKFTLEILKHMDQNYGDNIEIILFGCETDDPAFRKLPIDFKWINAGVLTRMQLALLLNEIDIFVDYSSFQAMGLTAMEAMACGAAVITPKQGGANSFIRNKENGIMVDVNNTEECLNALNELILNENFRTNIQRKAIFDICEMYPEKSAFNMLQAMFGTR